MVRRVLVVGAGIGGLCLAHGLRQAGIVVTILERDSGVRTTHGLRLRLDAEGIGALVWCLPPELVEQVRAASSLVPVLRGAVLDHQLGTLFAWGGDSPPPERASVVVNYAALREVMHTGLADTVEFGRQVVRVDHKGDSVCAYLADGGVETADVLVGADGIDSVVRQHLLPEAEIADTGLYAITGHATLDPDRLPEEIRRGSCSIVGPDGLTLNLALGRDNAQWTLIGPLETFDLEKLHDTASRLVAGWHPAVARLVAQSDAAGTFAYPLRAALPVPPWPTTRITLLGDAVHANVPIGGSGATVTLRDAALLTESLVSGGTDPIGALADYEEQMREYGFESAVRSLHHAEDVFRAYIPALG